MCFFVNITCQYNYQRVRVVFLYDRNHPCHLGQHLARIVTSASRHHSVRRTQDCAEVVTALTLVCPARDVIHLAHQPKRRQRPAKSCTKLLPMNQWEHLRKFFFRYSIQFTNWLISALHWTSVCWSLCWFAVHKPLKCCLLLEFNI